MKEKKIIYWIISIILVLIISGCSGNEEIVDQISPDNGQGEATNEEVNHQFEMMTADELKELLVESVGIELRNTENEAIGMLRDREVILQFIEELYNYPKQQEFPGDSKDNDVIGPIHFYFNNHEELWGLVKDNYIYLEGYYFLLTGGRDKEIVKLFQKNVKQSPDGVN